METPNLTEDSATWIFFVHVAFLIALVMMCAGIYLLPVSGWIKGYLGMGLFFLVASTVTMTKTVRDRHEAHKIVNRVHEAKTEKILKDYIAWVPESAAQRSRVDSLAHGGFVGDDALSIEGSYRL